MKWLSVKKHKPNDYKPLVVLIKRENEIITAYAFEGDFITQDCYADTIKGVTHFLYLPDPKEIEEES